MAINRFLFFSMCSIVVGCTSAPQKQVSPPAQIEAPRIQTQQAAEVLQCEESRKKLAVILEEKDRQLLEKDQKIDDLRKKLELFGVFDK